MKKLSILATLAMGIFLFSSCESDRDDNPILSVPQAFNLLTPEIGDNVVNLKNSESIEFKAQAAPNYGFPTETSYWLQITEAADFSDPSKVQSTGTKGKSVTYDAPAKEIDLGIMKLRGYEEASQVNENETITLHVRMVASLSNATDSSTYVYSNPQTIKVNPYFLKESLPQFWYLTGAIIADGGWGNDPAKVGTSMIPTYVKSGESYDRFTGDGKTEYVGYFTTGEFKIIAPKGLINWNYGMCSGDLATGGFRYRNADEPSDNIKVTQAGYYRIVIDSKNLSMSSDKYTDAVTDYTSMKVGDKDMAAVTTFTGGKNHDWYATITLTSTTNMKFTASDNTTFGTASFPCGLGTKGGDNIPVKAGTYKVYFNDITGAYMFIEQK